MIKQILFSLILLSILLSGCGQKGNLYLPEDNSAAQE